MVNSVRLVASVFTGGGELPSIKFSLFPETVFAQIVPTELTISSAMVANNKPHDAEPVSKFRPELRTALLIRRAELRLLDLFASGKLNGTLHTCVGQEWSGVAVARALQKSDCIFSNHRGHGHFLAFTGDVDGLFAEIMGKANGVCGGWGGSQHLCKGNFYSNGVLGGMSPIAAGAAFAAKLSDQKDIVVQFLGDGALGEGIVYETLNLAAKWELPLLIVVERNGYAQSTNCATTLAGDVAGRARAFGIEYRRSNTWDWEDLLAEAAQAVETVRTQGRPLLLEIETYRLKAHSKGDDNRAAEEIKQFEQRDWLSQLLVGEHPEIVALSGEVDQEIAAAITKAEASADCTTSSRQPTAREINWTASVPEQGRISDLIHSALLDQLNANSRLLIMGEDIEGAYGGAFKITRDLSQKFTGRVRNTPISEAAIVGLGTGLALRGYRPVVEIMFGDFTTLIFDQLLQHACKFRSMYGEQVSVPLVVRTPMGGKRGYGPTHSQSIEKHFLGIPGLQIIALNHRVSPKRVYEHIFSEAQQPTLVIENKILYTRSLDTVAPAGFKLSVTDQSQPAVRLSPAGKTPQVTVVCYGGMLEDAERAALEVFDEDEILCEIICPTQIQPLDIRPIAESVRKTRRLVTVEEGTFVAALSSEITARLLEEGVRLERFERLGNTGVIPSAYKEEIRVLPGVSHIVAAIRKVST